MLRLDFKEKTPKRRRDIHVSLWDWVGLAMLFCVIAAIIVSFYAVFHGVSALAVLDRICDLIKSLVHPKP